MDLVPFTADDFAAYEQRAIEGYAQARVRSGIEPLAEARETAARQHAELLPDGLATPDHFFFRLVDGGEQVGMLWLNVRRRSDGESIFGYDFEVDEALRRRGLGRAAMVAAEEWARGRGAVALELNVFGDNLGARALYEQMGFVPTAIQMRKPLA